MSDMNQSEVNRLEKLLEEKDKELHIRLEAKNKEFKIKLEKIKEEVAYTYTNSLPWRVGSVVTLPFKAAHLFFKSPKRFIRNWRNYVRRGLSVVLGEGHFNRIDPNGQISKELKRKNLVNYPPFVPVKTEFRTSHLKIAVILDVFSYECFKYEADLLKLSKENWKSEIEAFKPDFLLLESVWAGNDGEWRYSMTRFQKPEGKALRELIDYCRKNDIKTVFWNKEDPPNYDVFKDVAKNFDFVFTTDEDCIPQYKKIVPHQHIYALPFAAQPALHNPYQSSKASKMPELCFAGTWYNFKHDSRREDVELLLDPVRSYDLHIFDRQYNHLTTDHYLFPSKYQPYIKGSLDYDAMLTAYRAYKVMLNVNSVCESPTMFSRRVFEALACGTPVISSPSLGMEEMLKEHVLVARTKDDTREHAEMLLGDEDLRQIKGHQAYRYVLLNHTYSHRMADMLNKIGLPSPENLHLKKPKISVVTATNRLDRVDNIKKNYLCQTYSNKELIVVLNNDQFVIDEVKERFSDINDVTVIQVPEVESLGKCLNESIKVMSGDLWSKFDDDNLYGPEFLTDLTLPFKYTDASIIGKRAYFGYLEGPKKLVLRNPDDSHQFTDLLSGSAILIKKEIFEHHTFPDQSVGEDTVFIKACFKSGFKVYSADPYNYVCVRRQSAEDHTWKVREEEFLENSVEKKNGELDLQRVFV
jgi:spore maturation protein CgeB